MKLGLHRLTTAVISHLVCYTMLPKQGPEQYAK
jgi:hypothetical protein